MYVSYNGDEQPGVNIFTTSAPTGLANCQLVYPLNTTELIDHNTLILIEIISYNFSGIVHGNYWPNIMDIIVAY